MSEVYDLIFDEIPPKDWWALAESLWTQPEFGVDPVDYDVWREVWETAPLPSPFPMPNGSGDEVTVYRGFDDDEQHALGFAWSLSEDVARRFMNRCGRAKQFSALAMMTIPSRDVLLYSNERSEQEVVCVPRPDNITIIDRKEV